MADVVAVMARLDGDAGGIQKASQVAERAYDQMVDAIEEGSGAAVEASKDMASKSESSFASMAKKGAGALAAIAGGAALMDAAFEAVNIKGTIAAQFDGTPEEVGAISQATQAAYTAGWGESLDEVSKTATGLQQTLSSVGQTGDLDALTEQAQALSQTFEVDTTSSIAAVRSMLTSGLAPDAQTAFDVITKGMQSGANSSDDLIDTLTEYSSQFTKLGIDGPAAIGLINQGLANGARNGDLVADAIKEFSIRAIDGSKTTAAGFEAIGLNAEEMTAKIAQGGPEAQAGLQQVLDGLRDMKDPAAQAQAAVGLFGTQAEDLGASLYALDPSSAVDAMGDVSGAAEDMASNSQSVQQQMQGLYRELMTGLGQALAPLVPILQDAMSQIGPILGQLGTALGPLVEALAPVLSSLLEAIMPIVSALGEQLSPILAAISPMFEQLGGILSGAILTVFSALGPILPPLIEALVGILSAVAPLLDPLLQLAAALIPIITLVAQLISAILPPVIQLFTALLTPIIALIGPLIGMLAPAITMIITVITTVISWIANFIGSLGGMGSVVASIGKAVGSVFTWLWSNAISPAISGITAAVGAVSGFISGAFSNIMGIVQSLGGVFSSVFGAIGGTVSSAFDGVVSIIRGSINGVIGIVNGAIGALNGVSVSIPDWVPGVGGQTFGISLPSIPMLAKGGTAIRGTMAIVGERGPEIVSLPKGASVTPAYPSAQALTAMAAQSGTGTGPVTFNNTFNVQNVDEAGLLARWQQTTKWQLEQAGANV